jgi:hypothetical protein
MPNEATPRPKSGLLNKFMQATAHVPGIFPKAMTGPIPGTLMWSLLGAGAGRYLAAPILSRLYPEYRKDKIKTVSTALGGLGGFAPGALLAYNHYDLGGMDTLLGGLDAYKPKSSVKSRREKFSSWLPIGRDTSPTWTQPSIPMNTSQHTINSAVANGQLGVYEAANLKRIMHEAKPQGSGLISPAGLARAAVSYGVGSLAGRVLGAVANATFSNFSPGEQKNLARGVGLGNLLFDTLGRLSK